MQITNHKVYGIEDALKASGLPMITHYDATEYNTHIGTAKHLGRASRLASNPTGSGHCTFLSGIVVQMYVSATVKWWEQWQRYHFQQIVSSMSTMHRLRRMMSEGTTHFNECTSPAVIQAFLALLNDETVTDETLAYSCPMGLELTAFVTTNYLQLKTMYGQRKHHKLQEWREFCKFVENLPYAAEFILTN